jgi:hypothetical protein
LRDRRDELEKLDQRFTLEKKASRDVPADTSGGASMTVGRGRGLGSYSEAVARQNRKAWNSPAKVPKSTCRAQGRGP